MELSNLNTQQRKAVEKIDGPLLVLAGAGSGKTRVLTHKIAYLIENKNVFPSEILAITFTNKAADEMKERINKLLKGNPFGLWMGTFHSICLKILRRNAKKIGYTSDFTIYDTLDQKTVIKNCMDKLNIDKKKFKPKMVMNIISMAKNELIDPVQFEKIHGDDFKYEKFIKIYKMYQKRIENSNAMDFNDLINKTIYLLNENEEVLEFYKDKFKHILIDEYQDTNYAQYVFASLLAGEGGNICAVGDGDQSIYKFRGADIRNIHEFEKDYKDAKIIKLERNYRSTKNILKAANEVIKNNRSRKPKDLWTDKDKGDFIYTYEAYNQNDEADYVYKKIKQFKEKNYDEFAILYRTNAQSRALEEKFMKKGIPYQILGGLKFYERKEIKDVLGYLKLIQNPLDNVAFERVVNVPKRGIGKRSVEKLVNFCDKRGLSLYEGLLEIESVDKLSTRAKNKYKAFRQIIRNSRKLLDSKNALEIFEHILEKSKYMEKLKLKGTTKAQTRIENILEFKSVIEEFVKENEDEALSNFLAEVTLQTSVDTMDDEQKGVLMLTVHSAKGLEFPNVFLVGMEENIFPSYMSKDNEEDIEEERRLCYVGITRAQKRLFITHATSRLLYGRNHRNESSRFLEEIPENLKKYDQKSLITQNNKNEVKKDTSGFSPGKKVKHKQFGVGTIIELKEDIVTIAFPNQGMKKLMIDIAPIEVI
ncbi:MAG: ATP-dependent helicase [Bacillota bacterium]